MNFLRLSATDLLSSKGKLIFNHSDKSENGSAYLLTEACSVSLFIPRRIGAIEVKIALFRDNCSEPIFRANAEYLDFSGQYDLYCIKLPINQLGVGLFFGAVSLKTPIGEVYARKDFNELAFSHEKPCSAFQLSVSDFLYAAPGDEYGGIIYHIFVDRFARGGKVEKRRDAIMIDDWYSEIPEYPKYPGAYLENNSFFGGTLWGVVEKLDYIKSLGVSLIYLSPIFEAYSNHKYDTANYMKTDSGFGGEEALVALINEAKKRNIGIILDGVFNHTGADSIYFNKFSKYDTLGAYQSKESPYFSWYEFKNYPNEYTAWWGIEILPRINPNVKSCESYLLNVIEKYAKLGISGFRLDVADELSDEFISKIKCTLNKENNASILYGEVWEDASNKIAYDVRKKYYLGNELDGVMNYPARSAIISFVKNGKTCDLKHLLYEVLPNAPKRIRDMQMNLLGTHDTERILTVLGGENSEGHSNDYLLSLRLSEKERTIAKQKLFMAYAISATLPGIPSIFYGDEVGLEGYSDPFNRRTFPWGREDADILNFYKKIGKIRRENDVYKLGGFKTLLLTTDLLVFERYKKNTRIITAVNNSNTNKKLKFKNNAKSLIRNYDARLINLPPHSVEIIKTNDTSFNFC